MTQPADNHEGDELTDAEKRELDKRLAAYESSGCKGDSWENIVKRIRAKKPASSSAPATQIGDAAMTQPADNDEYDELTDAQKRELDRRLAAYEANPDDVIPWETVRKELWRKQDDPK